MLFENEYGAESYSECFRLCSDIDKEPGRGQYSLDEEYFNRLIEFANADGSGAKYCFWVNEEGVELENAPIVVIGSEGHIQIISKNIKELLQLLSFGPEPMDGKFYKLLDDFEELENAKQFRKWMKDELSISPIKNIEIDDNPEVNTIVEKAVKEYGEPFQKWMDSLTPQYG